MLSALSLPPGRSWEAIIKRCAIYTRKSSAERLDLGLNTLDAQRQFCESYIASQAGEGWVALATRYDDGGFSGGSLDRPAVQRLTEDVAAGHVDVVVVYKIDRLSRSLLDFSTLLGRFEARGVSFVSVTQAFNTSQSMGRLTLNVLLSFAQFERELASERLRDKAAASRAIGLWTGGVRPFGYQVDKGRLAIDEGEAEIVRYVFRRFVQLRSVRHVARDLNGKGFRNKTGGAFTHTIVARMIRNRLYRGDLVYQGRVIPGKHAAIVTEGLWLNAREVGNQVATERRPSEGRSVPNPLKGLIFGPAGNMFGLNTHHNRYGQRFRYYVPSGRKRYGDGTEPRDRFRADAFDAAVLDAIQAFVPRSLDRARTGPTDLLRKLVSRIDVGQDDMVISLKTGATVEAPVTCRVRGYTRRGTPGPIRCSDVGRCAPMREGDAAP
jgi:site-specific DNA recombinase